MGDRERLSSTMFGTKMSARFAKTKTRRGAVYAEVGLLEGAETSFTPPQPVTEEGSVTGWVTGCEPEGGENDVLSLDDSLSRKNIQKAVTTRHPSQPYCQTHTRTEEPLL